LIKIRKKRCQTFKYNNVDTEKFIQIDYFFLNETLTATKSAVTLT